MQEFECLALGRTEGQHWRALEIMRAVASRKYHDALVAAGYVHTAEVREEQQTYNALNRVIVEMMKLEDAKMLLLYGDSNKREFVAAEWMHECARTTKRDGIPVFDGKYWMCSRCKSGHGVDVRGTTLDVAIEMFWKYLANGSWKRRVL